MNNSREKFYKAMHKKYAWNNCEDILANHDSYSERVFLCVYYSWEAWQAATEQSQKEIAEKDAMIAEYDRLMSIDDTRIVLLQHNIVELQAREKVLVEALEHYEPVISAIDNSKGFVARQALANVRGE